MLGRGRLERMGRHVFRARLCSDDTTNAINACLPCTGPKEFHGPIRLIRNCSPRSARPIRFSVALPDSVTKPSTITGTTIQKRALLPKSTWASSLSSGSATVSSAAALDCQVSMLSDNMSGDYSDRFPSVWRYFGQEAPRYKARRPQHHAH